MAVQICAQDEGSFAQLKNFKLPYYNDKTGKLQFILYGDKGTNMGELVNIEGVLLDMVREDIKNINQVKDMQSVKLYTINPSNTELLAFWAKYNHSNALLYSPSAVFDKISRTVKGREKIFFRSPMMDIDGEGFDAELASKTIIIRQNVKLVIRASTDDAKKMDSFNNKNGKVEKKNSEDNDNVKKPL